jgi:hypothetical protein
MFTFVLSDAAALKTNQASESLPRPDLYGARYIRPLPSRFILSRRSALSNYRQHRRKIVSARHQCVGPVDVEANRRARAAPRGCAAQLVRLTNVRCGAHYGLKSDISRGPKSINSGPDIPRCLGMPQRCQYNGCGANDELQPFSLLPSGVATQTRSVISQTSPSLHQSKRTFPFSWVIIPSMIRLPTPFRVGSCTAGPPLSVQSRRN